MKKNYNDEASRLRKAIDIAIDSFLKFPPKDFLQSNVDHVVKTYLKFKEEVIDPDPKFKNLTSLRYTEESVFTYFQEASGDTVNYFWKQIKDEHLSYTRANNRLLKILTKGKISSQIEYDYVTDMIIAAEQEMIISIDQAFELKQMIGVFEKSRKR